MTLCLGKLPARPNAIKFKLSTYVDLAALPPVPKDFGHEAYIPPINWQMLANNKWGCCVISGAGHETKLWSREGGKPEPTFTDTDIAEDFTAITGQPPGPDNGADMQAAASYRLRTGLRDNTGVRHKIGAYLEISPGNLKELYAAMYLFGAVGIGFRFPTNTGFAQFANHQSWHIVSGMTFDGSGHYVPGVALRGGNIVCVTWGRFQAMRPSFFASLCDEAVAYVSPEMLTAGKSPEGLDYASLIADLNALAA